MNLQKIKIIITAVLAISALSYMLNKAITQSYNRLIVSHSGQHFVMNTIAKITVTAKTKQIADSAIASALKKIESVEKLMSRFDPNSALSKINQSAFTGPVKIDAELFTVIKKAIDYSKKSDGAFDITVTPLIIFWKNHADSNTAPTPEQLKQIHNQIGYQNLIINTENQTIKFAVDKMMLDLGAIAKGYAIDAAIDAIKSKGVLGAMVDIGGDLRCFGHAPKNGDWIIGLQNPKKTDYKIGSKIIPADSILLKLKVANKAIATSGDYQRYVTIAGKKYSHIINPATDSATQGLTSVTIISDAAIDADALATTVSVLGTEKGLALIENTPQTEAIIIPSGPSQQLIKSSGADAFITK